MPERLDVSVILPCRNEENTVGACIDEAMAFLKKQGLSGEILVVDNASEDGSAKAAGEHGARVVKETRPGYGNVLRAGIRESSGEILLMADCDTTYDLGELERLYDRLKNKGFDMVIGDRFAGGIEPGAMSLSHVFGGKLLSALGRLRFHTDVKDFHCGIRGMTKEAASRLMLHTEGMEFATEMIAEAAKSGMRAGQVPVSLKKCRFPRKSKLRTVRDGLRHLCLILRG